MVKQQGSSKKRSARNIGASKKYSGFLQLKKWGSTSWRTVKKMLHQVARRWRGFMERRPHRTFRLTRRRDYRRSFELPGYWGFTTEVWQTLWRHKKVFGPFFILYAVLSGLVLGLLSQESYMVLSEGLDEIGQEFTGGNFGGVTRTSALFVGVLAGIFTQPLSEGQQIYGSILLLFGWLVMVWLLRQLLAGHATKLRDGLYSAGAPIAATFVVTIVILLQLLPVALGLIVMSIIEGTGIIDGGVEAMTFWVAFGLLVVMSLYWLAGSSVALITVTLPGMYPFAALKTAGDLVAGRRLRIMLRLLWLLLVLLVLWIVLLVPMLLLDQWLSISWLPFVPVMVLVLIALSLMFVSTYVYLFYRRLLDDDAPPA